MKKDKNRKLHGSVLLTVVFVMAILIVFLFGTMSLAIAANNRSHVNYSSAQTQITARAVAESAIEAVANDSTTAETYAKAVAGLEAGQELTVSVQLSSEAENRIGTMGNVSDVTISHVGTTKFYDPIKNQWEDRDVLKFTATVDMAGVQSTSSVYVVKHLERDKSLGGGGGAGFVTTAGANLDTQTSIFGGAYINLPTEEQVTQYVYTGTYEERVAIRPFYKGGVENNIATEADPRSRFYTLNEGAVIEADLVVNNDMFIENWSGFIFPGKSTGITIWGDLQFHNNAKSHLNYIMNDIPQGEISFNEVPYIYVDGRILGSPSGDIGVVKLGNATQNFPLNTFCASIEATNTTGIISTNIYCMDKELTSEINGAQISALYSWADGLTNKVKSTKRTSLIKGEICSKGNLILENVTITGDVRVEGTLTIGDTVTINGKVVAGKIIGEKILGTPEIYANVSNIGFYYVYTPEMNGEGKFVAINGEVLNDTRFTDGVPNEEYAENIPEIYHILETGWYPSREGSENHVTGNEENTDYFYSDSENLQLAPQDEVEKAYIDMLPPGATIDPNNLAGYKINTNTDESNIKSLNDYINENGSIYPIYAEREAVLGINGYGEDTKIVRTLEEVFKDVANPYDAEELPSEFGADVIYEELESDIEAKYPEGYNNENEVIITKKSEIKTSFNNTAPTIKNSCIIDGVTFNKGLVLDPSGLSEQSMVVVIRGNVTIDGAPLYVNDAKGKKVYIYIEDGGTLKLAKGRLVTNTYKSLFEKASLGYNSSDGYDIKQNTNHIPNVYVYGEQGGTIDLGNCEAITAYVKSPYLKAHISGSGSAGPTSFYYNNYNVINEKHQELIIGCFNVQEVDSDNPVNVVYIPENDDDGGGTVDQKGKYWYRPYYYSEF